MCYLLCSLLAKMWRPTHECRAVKRNLFPTLCGASLHLQCKGDDAHLPTLLELPPTLVEPRFWEVCLELDRTAVCVASHRVDVDIFPCGANEHQMSQCS